MFVSDSSAVSRSRIVLYILVAIVALGFDLRFRASIDTKVAAPLREDAASYFLYAYNLRYHGVYSGEKAGYDDPKAAPSPEAARNPGYPLFLLPFVPHKIGRNTTLHIALAQALLGTLLILLVFLIGREFLTAWGALGAALLTALSPHLINIGIYVLSETWYTFLLAGGLYLSILAIRNPGRRWLWLCAGALLGAAALTRPGIQYFLVVLAVLLWCSLDIRWRGIAVVLVVAGFFFTLGPWFVRNEIALGKSTDNTLKINFLQDGMYPDFMYRDNPRTYGYPYRYDPRSKEIGRSVSSVLKEIKHRFEQEPRRELTWYLLGKPKTLWSWNMIAGEGDTFVYAVLKTPYFNVGLFQVTHSMMRWFHLPLLIFAMIGTILAWRPTTVRPMADRGRLALRLVSLLLIYTTGIHMIGAPYPRYSIPYLPFVFVMALFAVQQMLISPVLWLSKKREM